MPLPTPNQNETESEYVSRCMQAQEGEDKPEKQKLAICYSQYRNREAYRPTRHRDFQRIYDEFQAYYPSQTEAEKQYYDWIKALGVDETKEYARCRESYYWTKDDIQYVKEDEENKYYEVEIGFPTKSMNGNVYKTRDFIAASLTLPGKSPSLNHKNEFWFSPKNPDNKWGNITIVEGKFHENRSKALMKVPKNMVCPVCNGEHMTKLLDEKRIFNVSLEGDCVGGQCVTGECNGFVYNDPPFTLLTTDVLPGIPMTRIKPLESIMVEALQVDETKTKEKNMQEKETIVLKLQETPMSTDTRNNLPDSAFCGPDRTYPCNDAAHVRNALARLAQNDPGNTKIKACILRKAKEFGVDVGESALTEEAPTPDNTTTTVNPPPHSKPPFNVTQPISQPEIIDHRLPVNVTVQNVQGETMVGASPSDGTGELRGFTQPAQLDERLKYTEERLRRTQAESRAKGLDEHVATLENANVALEKTNLQLTASLEEQKQTVKRLSEEKERNIRELQTNLRNAEVERDNFKHLRDEAAEERDAIRKTLEQLQKDHAELATKYDFMVNKNLDLTKKNIANNEARLELDKKVEALEDALRKKDILAKKTIRVKA